ncbi:winged helix-turn-helix domain-containing protein [Nonomuraea sp. NPDC049152]|uniref:winged helix-turn-helix domain-containing protein n=1 Tax=Nonomuraea sp. NPDC049152 TaxID=3154350 RepID=UPI0033F37A25
MRIEVLGPVLAYAGDGAPIDLGGTRVRALLARLALARNEVVSVDSLLDGLWGEHSSGGTVNALHALVHRLRKALAGAGAVPPPARILDVGGGTGVRAQWLAADGYEVHPVDPVPA